MADANGRVRVVVTGMGAISPIGNDRQSTWKAAREGRSGIAGIEQFDASQLPVRIAGEIKDFDPADAIGRKEARRSSRAMQLAMVAAREAVQDSGLDIAPEAEEDGGL